MPLPVPPPSPAHRAAGTPRAPPASAALERVALRSCQVTTAGIYVLLQRPGLKRVVISKCPLVTLVSLAHGGEPNLRVVTEAGLVPPAAAPDAGAALAAGIAPPLELAGQDMQLLVAEV